MQTTDHLLQNHSPYGAFRLLDLASRVGGGNQAVFPQGVASIHGLSTTKSPRPNDEHHCTFMEELHHQFL